MTMKPPQVLTAEFSGILFDMDGLVLDSEATYVSAWQRAARDLGKSLADSAAERLFGRHADDVAVRLGEMLGPSFDRADFFKRAEGHWFEILARDGIPRMPGIEALLEHLRQNTIPFALATNSDRHYADKCLGAAGLDQVFQIMVTRDQVAQGKPAPDLFEEGARRLGLTPARCLVLEDSETGLRAARAAGCYAVLIQQRSALRDTLSPLAHAVYPDLDVFLSALCARDP
jgi:HAD superfamily hydrolase (TIGR01509 family)